jgi:nicotinamide-nucleotide amidase
MVMPDADLAGQVADLLGDRMIATAESCTAGRIAEVLATVPGAVEFLRGGIVAYQTDVKRNVLGVVAAPLTSDAAEQMALGVARALDAQVAVATTGVAGDESEGGLPPGTVYIATAIDGIVVSDQYRFDGTPEEICAQARHHALLDLRARLSVGATG